MQHSWRIGRVAGIDIFVDSSWFFILVLFTWMLATSYFPEGLPGYRGTLYWPLSLVTSLLVFACVLAHELAHSIVAVKQGDPVRRITLFILGGVAQITEEPKDPLSEFVMAVVGPIASFILGSFFFLLAILFLVINAPLRAMFFYLGLINIVLGAFNLLPGFPMDGGRVLRSIVWKITGDLRKSTRIASLSGQAFSFLLVAIGIFQVLGGSLSGLWMIFIGWFLYSAAARGYKQVLMKSQLSGVTASDLMVMEFEILPADMSVKRLVNDYILKRKGHAFLVGDKESLEGVVCFEDVKAVPRRSWPEAKVKDIMTPREKLEVVSPDTDGENILARFVSGNIHQVSVMEGDEVMGIICRSDIFRYVQLRSDLEKS